MYVCIPPDVYSKLMLPLINELFGEHYTGDEEKLGTQECSRECSPHIMT